MSLSRGIFAVAALAVFGLGLPQASANTVTTVTVNTNSTPVDNVKGKATAILTFDTNTLTITLSNDINSGDINPYSIGSAVRGISFTINQTPSLVGTATSLFSATGTEIELNGSGVITSLTPDQDLTLVGPGSADGWDVAGTDPYTVGIGLPSWANSPLILGNPGSGGTYGTYANTNPSVTGGSHNPLVEKTATFVLTINGLSPNATVGSASIFFGTSTNPTGVTGNVDNGLTPGNTQSVPLPASVWAGGSLLAGLALVRRIKRKSIA